MTSGFEHGSNYDKTKPMPFEELVLPHVVFCNLHYRRVCAPISQSSSNHHNYSTHHRANGTSHVLLCMTIRYPFPVPLIPMPSETNLNSSTLLPTPDDRFYNLTNLIWIDGPLLDECKLNRFQCASVDKLEFHCLEREALQHKRTDAVIALWTRRTIIVADAGSAPDEPSPLPLLLTTKLYGTQSMMQLQRLHQFFRGHLVLVVGDSNAPAVAMGFAQLFGTCHRQNKSFSSDQRSRSQHENGKSQARVKSNDAEVWKCSLPPPGYPMSDASFETDTGGSNKMYNDGRDTDGIIVTSLRYHPATRIVPMADKFFFSRPWHVVNDTKPFLEVLRSRRVLDHWKRAASQFSSSQHLLRPLAILVQYPAAHTQTNDMIHESIDQIRYNQDTFPQLLLNIAADKAKDELTKMGFQISHIMTWDGSPQRFPTATGGYDTSWFMNIGEGEDLNRALESKCRGPLPPNSILKGINQWAQHSFERNGLDMQFYGKTWEFSNQFWWQERMARWDDEGDDEGKHLDCTHGVSQDTGLTMVHKNFLQAMVDGYFDMQSTPSTSGNPYQS